MLSEYQSEPLAVAKDSNPLPIKYIGFKSKSNVAKFFFDCEGENEYGEDDLKSMCQYEEALEYDFLNFHKISDLNNAQPSGYLLNFLFFLQAESDARVRLTTIPEWSLDYDEYDLRNAFFLLNRFFNYDLMLQSITRLIYGFLCDSLWRLG